MKDLCYLSVQGWHAPSFMFRFQNAHQFRSLIECITLKQALVISSLYRTDIFYQSSEYINTPLTKLWCSSTGNIYDQALQTKFLAAEGEQASLELYFDTINHLKLHRKYFEQYQSCLSELFKQEPKNIILQELAQCDLYLTQTAAHKSPDLEALSTKSKRSFDASLVHFRELSFSYMVNPIYN